MLEFWDAEEVPFRFFSSVLAVMLLMQLWLATVICESEIRMAEPVPLAVDGLPCVRFLDREIRLIFNGCCSSC